MGLVWFRVDPKSTVQRLQGFRAQQIPSSSPPDHTMGGGVAAPPKTATMKRNGNMSIRLLPALSKTIKFGALLITFTSSSDFKNFAVLKFPAPPKPVELH